MIGWAAGRGGNDLEAVACTDGVGAAGLDAGFFFGRTNGSAIFGRRIFIGRAPSEPVGSRLSDRFVGADMVYKLFRYDTGELENIRDWK